MDQKQQQERYMSLLFELKSMGFSDSHCRRALQVVQSASPHALELSVHWMSENPETAEQRRAVLEALVIPLVNMGFSREQALEALGASGDNVEAAIAWLLSKQAQANDAAAVKSSEERKRSVHADEARAKKKAEFERRRQEAERIRREKLAAKREIRPAVLHYGDWVVLQSLRTQEFVCSPSGYAAVHANAPAVNEDCEMRIMHPDRPLERSPILDDSPVGLQFIDFCYIGTEANGEIHANRKEFGVLSMWTIKLIPGQPTVHPPAASQSPSSPASASSQDDSKAADRQSAGDSKSSELLDTSKRALFPDCVITLVSRLKSALRVEASGECSAQNSDLADAAAAPHAQWKVVFQRRPDDDRVGLQSRPSTLSILKDGPMTGKELWALLRRTYRLRALVLLREQLALLEESMDRERKQLQARSAEEHQCVVCFDNDPNTVLLECGHVCVCSTCGPSVQGQDCPICRQTVTSVLVMNR